MSMVTPQLATAAAGPEEFFARLEARLAEHPALRHPFLCRFADERLSKAQLVAHAAQHYLYSRHFTRNLGAVISNVPDERARSQLIVNMYEEIGEPGSTRDRAHLLLLQAGLVEPADVGEACQIAARSGSRGDVARVLLEQGAITREHLAAVVDIDAEQASELTHPALFRRFLRALGLAGDRLAEIQPIPETVHFIAEYEAVCRDPDWLAAMGAMGPGTECVVPALYSYVHTGIVNSNAVAPADYLFWTLHIHCDDAHGADIVRVLKPYATRPEQQRVIEEGAVRVLDARRTWFDGLERLVFSARVEAEVDG